MGLGGDEGWRWNGGGVLKVASTVPISSSQNNVEFHIRRGLARRQDKWLMGF